MDDLEKEILGSWERCRKHGIAKKITTPRLQLEPEAQRLAKQQSLVVIFQSCFMEIREAIATNCIFLLTDGEGFLLHQEEVASPDRSVRFLLVPGASLAEESCGSNAVALALRLQQPVCFKPSFHYCYLFQKWHCYATPLVVAGKTVGCLALAMIGRELSPEMIVIARLLGVNITGEFQKASQSSVDKPDLGKEQLVILKLLAQGVTTVAVAQEMGVSVNTIKYHKKRIFGKLAAQSTGEAVAKAIRMNLITPDTMGERKK